MIQFTCKSCGRPYKCTAEYAGKAIRCPCGKTLRIPAPAGQPVAAPAVAPGPVIQPPANGAAPAPAAPPPVPVQLVPTPPVSDAPVCPACRSTVDPESVICMECGTNLRSGRRLLTKQRVGVGREAQEVLKWVKWVSLVIPFAVTPYRSTVSERPPAVNRLLVLTTCLVSIGAMIAFLGGNEEGVIGFALWPGDRFAAVQLVSHLFLHAGLGHLIGNMIFLVCFGDAINDAVGGIIYPALYVVLGMIAGAAGHLMLQGPVEAVPLVGASGAIAGLSGMYIVLFPRHDIHMAAWFRWFWWTRPHIKTFPLMGIWAVLIFTSFDVLMVALSADTTVAHYVHLAGFGAGFVIGLVLLLTGVVNARGYDLLTWIMGNRWRPKRLR